jgi:hypothetical protein
MPTRFDSVIFDLDGTLMRFGGHHPGFSAQCTRQRRLPDNEVTLPKVQAVTGQPTKWCTIIVSTRPPLGSRSFAPCAHHELRPKSPAARCIPN